MDKNELNFLINKIEEIERKNSEILKLVSSINNRINPYNYNDIRHFLKQSEAIDSAKFLIRNNVKGGGGEVFPYVLNQYDLLEYAINESLKFFNIKCLFLEFGVFSGKSINFISSKFPEIHFFGFDSFKGLPEEWRQNYEINHFKCDIPKVNSNVTIVEGYFEETLQTFIKNNDHKIAFMHIDCDLYSSTKTIFKYLESNIVNNTIILFDELLNYIGYKNGEFKALNEFIEETTFTYKIFGCSEYQVALQIKK